MISKLSLSAAVIAAGLAFGVVPTSAAPASGLAPLKALGLEKNSGVEQIHFWHRRCRRGLNGWHKHIRGVGRVQCTTRRNGVWY